jgi:hypothetical protein
VYRRFCMETFCQGDILLRRPFAFMPAHMCNFHCNLKYANDGLIIHELIKILLSFLFIILNLVIPFLPCPTNYFAFT